MYRETSSKYTNVDGRDDEEEKLIIKEHEDERDQKEEGSDEEQTDTSSKKARYPKFNGLDDERENFIIKDDSSEGSSSDEDSLALEANIDHKQNIPPEPKRTQITADLANPLAKYTHTKLSELGEEYAQRHRIIGDGDIRAFRLGAILAQDPDRYDEITALTESEKRILSLEIQKKWSQPILLYLVIALCSMCAAVQGMDETVVNGAQLFYSVQFGIDDVNDSRQTWLLGLVNSAPYLCCAVLGCWLTVPFNARFGRRGTVFLTCLISAVTCFWQAFTGSWWHMFIARFCLGLGIGPKSATVPMYAAEVTPPKIRGALVMQWQMWTAFGIMVGYAADLAFYTVPDQHGIIGLNWRLMMGSAMLPAVIVCCFVFLCPESPRWYLSRGRHVEAYQSMCRLRYDKVQAARDVFYMQILLEVERGTTLRTWDKIREMFTVPRNRRAMLASQIVMFMQQFCGINVIAYYSSQIFIAASLTPPSALLASLLFGITNFLFAIPAIYTIDTFGRRNLLLATFPLMALFVLLTGLSFNIPPTSPLHITFIATSIYLFGMAYSPGEGPVPLTYSAEAYPLYIRAQGMSLATATTWFFNFVLSVTWPSMLKAFRPQGAFSWYAGWNVVGFFAVLFFVPETKGKTLEELDQVFSVKTSDQVRFGARQVVWFWKRCCLRRDVASVKMGGAEQAEYRMLDLERKDSGDLGRG